MLRIAVISVLFIMGSTQSFASECINIPYEKESTNSYIEYKEVTNGTCRYIVYAKQTLTKDEGWVEDGWILHRKNCPCGWASK